MGWQKGNGMGGRGRSGVPSVEDRIPLQTWKCYNQSCCSMNYVKTVMIDEWMIHIIHIYVVNILNGVEYQYSYLITCQMFTNGISCISRFIDQDN